MDSTDDAASLNLQRQLEELMKENQDLKFEIDCTKKRLLLKTREIGSIQDNIDKLKKILQKVLITLEQRSTPDQNDNSSFHGDIESLHETLTSLGVTVANVDENSNTSNKIEIEKLKEEVALLNDKLSMKAKYNEILNTNLAKQKSIIEKTAKLITIQNKELTEVFDELNYIGNSSIEHCDKDAVSELNEILEVTEDSDIRDNDYLGSGQKDIELAVELSNTNIHTDDSDEILREQASDLSRATVISGHSLEEVQQLDKDKLAFMSVVGLAPAEDLAQVTPSCRGRSPQPCNLLRSCDASLHDTAAAQEEASTTGYMRLRKRRVRDRALSSCSIQSGYLCNVAQACKTKCNSGQSAATRNSDKRKVVLSTRNRKLSKTNQHQQGCFSGQNKELMKYRDRALSSCSLQSGYLVGSGGDPDQASSSLRQKKNSILKMIEEERGKAVNVKQPCALCGKKLLNLKLHMAKVHMIPSEKGSTVQNMKNERVSFTIVTEEVDGNGAPIEDLECGMKPETTIKQVKKSYCKKMGLNREKIRLIFGGKILWEGQNVKGLRGSKVVAGMVGEAGTEGAVEGLEVVIATENVDEMDG